MPLLCTPKMGPQKVSEEPMADEEVIEPQQEQQEVPVMDFETFVSLHRNQLESSGVPQIFWSNLYIKLSNESFDSSNSFQLMKLEDEEEKFISWKVCVTREEGINADDPQHIYLVDHAWTFRPQQARQQLLQVPSLVERMTNLFDLNLVQNEEPVDDREEMDKILSEMWKFAGTYSLGNADSVEERMPVWYILDEFGSRIQHSDAPNVRLIPFVCLMDGLTYSLLFPIKTMDLNDEVLRDFLEGPEAQDPEIRKALLNTWNKNWDMMEISYQQVEPNKSFFEESRENESVPDEDYECSPLPKDRKIKVYAEYVYIGKNLNHPRFEMVEDREEADILWLTTHFKDFKNFSEAYPSKRINQFPFENVITIKDLLCVVARRGNSDENIPNQSESDLLKTTPDWLPTTYNLKTELPQFVSYFLHREKRGLDNHWIVKPWNLARALDTQISPHLHHILRLPFSGPKIAQKYLENPVLFDRPEIGKVKFDIRYILLLQSTKPLKVFAYNRFWLRFANVEFELKDLDVYEKHFTVMNYTDEADLKQMFCDSFIKDFERQYPGVSWKEIESEIFQMFKSLFESAVSVPPPCGIARSPQSRAMYAADLMLAWNNDEDGGTKMKMQPKLLEVNWGPDCKRACDYYPEFFDNVFSTLFLDSPEGQNVTLL